MVNFGLSWFNYTELFKEILCLMNDEAVLVIFVCEADLYSLKLYVSQLVSQWTSVRAKAFELKR